MTTYRKVAHAAPSIHVEAFEAYEDALAYSQAHHAHKPVRRMTSEGVRWQVGIPGDMMGRPSWQVVPEPTRIEVPVEILAAVNGAIRFDIPVPVPEPAILADDAWQSKIAPPDVPFRLPFIKPRESDDRQNRSTNRVERPAGHHRARQAVFA